MSRYSIFIILTMSSLNDLQVLGADVHNIFLMEICKDKIWLISGIEFGAEISKNLLVVRLPYGIKSASASFRSYMEKKLD